MATTKTPVDREAVTEYFKLVDRMPGTRKGSPELEAFKPWHTDDVRVVRGNHPPIEGLAMFEEVLTMPFPAGRLESDHHIHTYLRDGDRIALEMTIDYRLNDGDPVKIPCAAMLRMENELIAELNIYLDETPVYSGAALHGS